MEGKVLIFLGGGVVRAVCLDRSIRKGNPQIYIWGVGVGAMRASAVAAAGRGVAGEI